MTRKNAWAGLVAVVALSLSLTACKDTKTLQENEQLKTQVADLQKQNTQMNGDLQAATAARDELANENETLKAEVKPKKSKHSAKKTSRKQRRRS
jgi:FtsZ-binding cell division protein ZapB